MKDVYAHHLSTGTLFLYPYPPTLYPYRSSIGAPLPPSDDPTTKDPTTDAPSPPPLTYPYPPPYLYGYPYGASPYGSYGAPYSASPPFTPSFGAPLPYGGRPKFYPLANMIVEREMGKISHLYNVLVINE